MATAELKRRGARVIDTVGLTGPVMALLEAYRRRTPAGRANREAMTRLFSHFVDRGDVVFDVGANMGNRIDSCLALGARVVAIEPQELCVRTLRRRYGANPNVTIVPEAMGAAKGEHEMMIAGAHTISSMSDEWVANARETGRFSEFSWKRKVTVPVNTLDSLIEQFGDPAFVKIDVEGFETQVLAGLTMPLRALSLEYANGYQKATLQCVERLQSIGDYEYNYSIGESMNFGLEVWSSAAEISSFLNALPLDADWGDIYARLRPTT